MLPDFVEITIEIGTNHGTDIDGAEEATFDGDTSVKLSSGDRIVITRSMRGGADDQDEKYQLSRDPERKNEQIAAERRYNMKIGRQARIVDLIAKYDIETQEELADYLKKEGYRVTQATISERYTGTEADQDRNE